MADINKSINDEFNVHDEAEIKAIHDFDFERVGLLLNMMEKLVTVAPRATSLFGIAQAEIEILNEQAKSIAKARAEKSKEAEHARFLAEQDRRAKEIEAEDKAREQNEQRRASPKARAAAEIAPEPQGGMPSPDRRLVTKDSEQEDPGADLKPSVFPRDSQTATIADNNIDRRL